MTVLRVAWRNLMRNRRRTAITLTMIALTTAILIATMTLTNGMVAGLVRSATRVVVGHAQVHAPGYRKDRSMYKSIGDPEAILDAAAKNDIRAAPRSFGFGLVSSGTKSAGASYWGVDPTAERATVDLPDQLLAGAYLDAAPKGQAVIGRKLAKSLHAKVGSELVAVVQAADGSMGNELFTVAGILKTINEEIDRGAVILHQADFARLFVSAGRVHEIALTSDAHPAEALPGLLSDAASDDEVETWRELLPMISEMLAMTGGSMYIFMLIFYLVAALGVLNTMLMATHDRIRELGVLKALGATPWRIIRDVAAEGLVLALVGCAVGLVLGNAASVYLETVGIDLTTIGETSFSMAGLSWDPIWRGEIELSDSVFAVIAASSTSVLATLYPAVKAARLDPARAMTHV